MAPFSDTLRCEEKGLPAGFRILTLPAKTGRNTIVTFKDLISNESLPDLMTMLMPIILNCNCIGGEGIGRKD